MVIAKGGANITPPKDNTLAPPLLVGGSLSRTKDPTKHGPAMVAIGSLWWPNTTLQRFAESLSTRFVFDGEKRTHVVDNTGLEGPFDISLTWTPRKGGASIASQNQVVGDTEITIFDAIQEQLGLKLESKKTPVEMIVIESVEKPSEN